MKWSGDVLYRFSITLGFTLALTTTVSAQWHSVGSLPGWKSKATFRMMTEIQEVPAYGYQSVKLVFTPLGRTFKRDYQIDVIVQPSAQRRTKLDLSFQHSVTLHQGAASEQSIAYVPYYYPWERIQVELREDGVMVDKGRMTFGLGGALRTRFAEQVTTVGVVLPADTDRSQAWGSIPDVRTLVTVLGDGPIPSDGDQVRLAPQAAIKLIKRVQPAWVQFRQLDEQSLHDRWLAYSQLDVMLIAAPVLARIEQQQPSKLESIRDWVTGGGNLWVYAADQMPADSWIANVPCKGVDIGRVVTAKRALDELQLHEPNDDTDLIYDSWNGVRRTSQQYTFGVNNQSLPKRKTVYETLEKANHPFAKMVPPEQIMKSVQTARWGVGKIVAIDSPDPFPGSFQFWKSIVQVHPTGQLTWTERNGIDITRGNDHYWLWLLPSVGQPPVKSFVLLNTLFVVVIGPVSYFFLRRRKRLYLLYFVAPALAVMVTMSLFFYALASDGLTTKLRTRQLTWIDGTNATTVNQSRQTLYAVLGTKDGITASPDTAIYPVLHTPALNRYYDRYGPRGTRGIITGSPSIQRFKGNFLPPRNQVQYLTSQPSGRHAPLAFHNDGDLMRLTNSTPYDLHELVYCDDQGKLWRSGPVSCDKTVELKPCDKSLLADLLDEHVIPVPGAVPELQSNAVIWGGRGTGVQISALERSLGLFRNRLPTKSFIGLAELDNERLLVQDAEILNSVHVVMGVAP